MLPLDGYARVTTGQRRSELFALKSLDVDFSNLTIDVQRSIYLGKIGTCKTEAYRKPVPLDERVAADLWLWKQSSKYRNPNDWIFASLASTGNNRSGQTLCCKRSSAQLHCALQSAKGSGGIRFALRIQPYPNA